MIPGRGIKIIALAPMAGYTDFVYRKVVRSVYLEMATTEMISVKALIYNNVESWKAVLETMEEPETGIQLFGSDPDDFRAAIQMIESKGSPPFFELNAGCPVKKVVKKGAGAYLLKDLPRLEKILRAMRMTTNKPVAIKTRLGWDDNSIVVRDVVAMAEANGINWITIHGRTRNQMYGGRANLDLIGEISRSAIIPVIANGDIKRKDEVESLLNRYPLAGVAIGRAAIGNPWIFRIMRGGNEPSPAEKVSIIYRHIDENIAYYGEKRGVLKMIPHLVKYIKSVPDAKKFRDAIVKERDPEKLKLIVREAFGVKEPA